MKARLPFAIVHHANQYLITDGYDNRQGLDDVLDGYAPGEDFYRVIAGQDRDGDGRQVQPGGRPHVPEELRGTRIS